VKVLRCAIYTRKSSEEGLEHGFNSLHAQREACAAYVLSQAGEGWVLNDTIYDDGGFSGGSMNRPGLQALMADIEVGKVDVVVVYKVDRLTRSLADFARIVELFDRMGVSFVSITQAFNTTTSMGRLTLNVLLSFAQFEREVTGERIRDKIAASKKKGMWMGGRPPLGYDGVDRKLVINLVEAETVRLIFHRYLELGSVIQLQTDLIARGVESKRWTGRDGQPLGGGHLGRGALYHLLSNEVYLGGIRHRDVVYPDCHPPIIDREIWDQAQALLRANRPDNPDSPRLASPVLLSGLLYDARDVPMVVVHSKRGSKRYRYYAAKDGCRGQSRPLPRLSRIAMGVMDDLVLAETPPRLRADFMADADLAKRIRAALIRVQITEENVLLSLRPEAASNRLEHMPGRVVRTDAVVEVTIPVVVKSRQGALLLEPPQSPDVAGRIDRALVRAVALSRSWAERLARGEATSLKALALAEGYCNHYAARLLPLAWLAPDLVEQILSGRQPRAVSLGALVAEPLPMDWDAQRQVFASCGRRDR
jgi:DNA invertase Pin-like site-specific DNA recombinase